MYKKSFLFIALTLMLANKFTLSAALPYYLLSASQTVDDSKGTIHQEGEVLIALCEDDLNILSLTIVDINSGNVVINLQGCYQSKCNYDISSLNTGRYIATVLLSDGSYINLIFIK